MKSILAVRQRKIDYRREAKKKSIIAVRQRKNPLLLRVHIEHWSTT
jgi:hypothetical protein